MNKNNNNIIIGALIAVIAVMGVAFAAFSANLTINGTATIASTWKVTFTAGSCTSTVAKDAAAPSSGTVAVSGTTATITANMSSPGDKITCTIVAKNEGTLAAKRSDFVLSTPLASATNYTVTLSPTGEGTTLKAKAGTVAGGQENLSVVIEYKNVTAKPSAAETFKATATYVQDLEAE